MALTESKLRRIVREETARVMSEGMGEVMRVSYVVPVSDAPRNLMGIEMQEKEAFKKAVERAKDQFPGYEWELRKESEGSKGMVVHSSPRDGDPPTYRVFLVGHPEKSPWEHIPGEEEEGPYEPRPRQEDLPKWLQRDELEDLPRRRRR